MTTKIILADDHKLMREGLRGLLERQADLEVVGEVDDGRSAVRLASELHPDVVIMDIGMPALNGIEATRQIKSELPQTKIIGLSMHVNQRMVVEMLRAGASGYVSKLSAFEELARAVEAVIRGERYLSPSITGFVVDELLDAKGGSEPSVFTKLTSREREVLQLIAEGKSSKEIASALHISVRTVDVHRKNLMDKLEIDSVADLTRYAIREGMVSSES